MSGSENPTAEPRPAASLTAGLLARRGGARPAMRRQPINSPHSTIPLNDDLGWNDMGDDLPSHAEMFDEPEETVFDEAEAPAAPVSPITEQLNALAERIKSAPKRKGPRRVVAAALAGDGRKAAFTLRLDTERHLRLRLLSAMSNRSAQQLLVEALDAVIAQNPQLKGLADQVEAQPALPEPDLKWGS